MVAQMIIRGKFEAVMAMKTIDRARRSTEDGKYSGDSIVRKPKTALDRLLRGAVRASVLTPCESGVRHRC